MNERLGYILDFGYIHKANKHELDIYYNDLGHKKSTIIKRNKMVTYKFIFDSGEIFTESVNNIEEFIERIYNLIFLRK